MLYNYHIEISIDTNNLAYNQTTKSVDLKSSILRCKGGAITVLVEEPSVVNNTYLNVVLMVFCGNVF